MRNKFGSCYLCYAYEGDGIGNSCLVGEKQLTVPTKYGNMLYATRPYCKIKNIKDYLQRAEKFLERITIK